ncbi:MAG: hypothetical protein HY675_08955 [Chloroflexi bacterium]|nr:hypothetical protein [Chloroflexota bacterium]
MTTTVRSAIDSVTSTTMLDFTALRRPSNALTAALSSAGHAFSLDALAYPAGTVIPGFQFSAPVVTTVYYSAADVLGMDENQLALLYWSGTQWQDASTTCTPTSAYTRYPTENRIALPICRVGEFALVGQRTVSPLFLPGIYKN